MTTALVTAAQLGFGFASAPALFTDLNFVIPTAGVTLIQGGESRGKSTLLRLLAGQLQPGSGQLRMHGQDMHAPLLANQIYAHEPRQERWHEQTPRQFWAQLAVQYPHWDEAAAEAMLQHLQLAEHSDKAMYMLSTGSKRKVGWVAALACGAELLLMDEPFAALDLASIRKLQQLLGDWPAQHRSAWVLADYQPPGTVPLAALIDLGD